MIARSNDKWPEDDLPEDDWPELDSALAPVSISAGADVSVGVLDDVHQAQPAANVHINTKRYGRIPATCAMRTDVDVRARPMRTIVWRNQGIIVGERAILARGAARNPGQVLLTQRAGIAGMRMLRFAFPPWGSAVTTSP